MAKYTLILRYWGLAGGGDTIQSITACSLLARCPILERVF